MGRTNPDNRTPNPAFRFFEWKGSTGEVVFYDKDKKENVTLGNKFAFVLLGEYSTIRGYNKAAKSGVYANEVSDIQTQPLTVKIHKGNEVVSEGLYKDIKEHVTSKAIGGSFAISAYIAVKDGGRLRIANILFKGASLGAWFDFRKTAGKELYTKAIAICGSKDEENGATEFKSPIFALRDLTPESDDEAGLLQKQVQEYMKAYQSRFKAPADVEPQHSPEEEPAPEPDREPEAERPDLGMSDSEIPFN